MGTSDRVIQPASDDILVSVPLTDESITTVDHLVSHASTCGECHCTSNHTMQCQLHSVLHSLSMVSTHVQTNSKRV